MKFVRHLILSVAAVSLLTAVGRADDLATSANPYSSIVERNIFALVPIPTNAPVVDPTPVDPPLKITPNGIMTLFGKLEVLYKVTTKAQPGQPPKDVSYMMAEGEREDDIGVTKIDDKAGLITFDNHGVVQQLALVDAPKQTTPAGGGGMGMNGGMGQGGGIPLPGTVAPGMLGRGGPAGRANLGTSSTPAPPSGAVGNGSTAAANQAAPAEKLTPEETIQLMEMQRAKWLDDKNPAAAIIPPTKLTDQLLGNGGDSAPAPPAPPAP